MYFKSNNTEVIKAYEKFNYDRDQLQSAADALAQEYNAIAIILGDSVEVFFAGLKFKNNIDINRDIWRKPERKFGISNLRSKPLKKELQVEFDAEVQRLKTLKEKYFPNGNLRVKKSNFYKTLGFDWGNLFFNSFSCFVYQNYLFIDTSILNITNASEILGSEYMAAQKAHNQMCDDKGENS